MNTQERIFPAWSLLDQTALELLLGPAPAISVVDHAQEGIAEAPLIALIRLLIARAIAGKGLCLTATGNLSRADVGALFAELDWPGFDKETALALNKVDPPPLNWSILKYVFWQSGGPNAEETP